jgi:thiamine pyrophosphokinase
MTPKKRTEMVVLDFNRLMTPDAAVVLLGGEPPQSDELLNCIKCGKLVAAADRGAALALHVGRVPDILVGDFDSLPPELLAECRQGGARIFSLPVHKDLTDGEYILQHLSAQGMRRLLILGGLGGRVDQLLANILTAVPQARQGVEILFAHDDALLYVLAADNADEPQELVLRGFAGRTVSLISLAEESRAVELAGFEYPLHGALKQNVSLGVSNVVQAEGASIRLTDGCLLVCINL